VIGTEAAAARGRLTLDLLVPQMTEPGFVIRYRRLPVLRERSGHVSPTMLANVAPRSRYARRWRRHAVHCSDCAAVFRYLGFAIG
jgi:hypothetical protein